MGGGAASSELLGVIVVIPLFRFFGFLKLTEIRGRNLFNIAHFLARIFSMGTVITCPYPPIATLRRRRAAIYAVCGAALPHRYGRAAIATVGTWEAGHFTQHTQVRVSCCRVPGPAG